MLVSMALHEQEGRRVGGCCLRDDFLLFEGEKGKATSFFFLLAASVTDLWGVWGLVWR